VPASFLRSLLALLALLVTLGSSSALRVCVNEGRVGVEPSWVLCGEVADCCSDDCESEAPPSPLPHEVRDEGCRDYVLAFGSDWIPSETGGDCPGCVIAWRPLPAASVVDRCPRRMLPPGLAGVPPPLRLQRSPILRC